jgi:hypothetical protein
VGTALEHYRSTSLIPRPVQTFLRKRYPEALGFALVGSYAEGLANVCSDFDIVTVFPPKPTGGLEVDTIHDAIGDHEITLFLCTISALEARLLTLDETFVCGMYVLNPLETRLPTAIPFAVVSQRLRSLLKAYTAWKPAISTLAALLKTAASFYVDALGSMASNDVATARLMNRQGAICAMDSFLLSQGIINVSQKWHLRRLLRLPRKDIHDLYVAAMDLSEPSFREAPPASLGRLICAIAGVDSMASLSKCDWLSQLD